MSNVTLARLRVPLSLLIVAISTLYVVLPALSLGFVSDDFVHLVRDRAGPWYYSSDSLYRPFRNGLFKMMVAFFGLQPQPYRIFALLAYLLCGFLFYRLLLTLDLGVIASTCATFLAFFDPRNHALLFWFSAIQDLLFVICVLGMILSWIRFRRRKDSRALVISVALYATALGFKETAVVCPVLVVLVDWFFLLPQTESEIRTESQLAYVGFLLPLALLGCFVYWYPDGVFRRAMAEAVRFDYGRSDATGIVLAESRSVLNLLLPFEPPFALRDIGFSLGLRVAVVTMLLGGVVGLAPNKKIWLFAAVWVFVMLLPTSMFARAKNEEYYFFFPGFGLATAISMSFRDIAKPLRRRPVTYLLAAVLIFYCTAGTWRLKGREKEWQAAAATVQQLIGETAAVLPRSASTHVDFVNVPHDLGGIPVLNNGLRGALMASGYSSNLSVTYNGDLADPKQPGLISAVRACSMTEPQNDNRVLLVTNAVVTDHTSRCARDAIAEDVRLRPWAWFKDPRN